jgi:hypothetical protein
MSTETSGAPATTTDMRTEMCTAAPASSDVGATATAATSDVGRTATAAATTTTRALSSEAADRYQQEGRDRRNKHKVMSHLALLRSAVRRSNCASELLNDADPQPGRSSLVIQIRRAM